MTRTEYGTVLDVSTVNVGTTFVAAASIGATTLFLEDVSMFSDLGGQVLITDDPFVYTAINPDLNTMTLLTGLTVAAAIDDRVEIWPPAPVRSAMVQFGVEGEAVRVTIPHFFSGLPDGVRDVDEREAALVEERNPGELFVKDVMAKGMTILGPGCNLDEYTSQGVFIQLKNANVSLALNYPELYAGILEVFATQPGQIMMQRYTTYRTVSTVPKPHVWTRVFYFLSGWSAWVPNTDPVTDTGWIHGTTSLAVASTGWAWDSAGGDLRKIGDQVFIQFFLNYTGAGITVPTSGNITNTNVCQLVTAYRPGLGFSQGGPNTMSSGRNAVFIVQSDGTIQITAVAGTPDIATNDSFSIGGSFLLNG
jgi:hypothetical protein